MAQRAGQQSYVVNVGPVMRMILEGLDNPLDNLLEVRLK